MTWNPEQWEAFLGRSRAGHDQPLATTAEVARWLHVSPGTVRKLIHEGKLRSFSLPGGSARPGRGGYRIAISSVARYLADSETQPPAEAS